MGKEEETSRAAYVNLARINVASSATMGGRKRLMGGVTMYKF